MGVFIYHGKNFRDFRVWDEKNMQHFTWHVVFIAMSIGRKKLEQNMKRTVMCRVNESL